MTPEQIEIFQLRVCAAQRLQRQVRDSGQRLEINASGYVAVHHGTSLAAGDAIREQGKFERSSFFAPSKKACMPHVTPKHGSKAVYGIYWADPQDLSFSSGSGEFFAEHGLVRDETGMWISPVRASLQVILAMSPELGDTNGRCHDLALALLSRHPDGCLEALMRQDDEDVDIKWYSHMVFVSAGSGESWDAGGNGAIDRWTGEWDKHTEWEYLDYTAAELPEFLRRHGQVLRPAMTPNKGELSCPSC